ncbi:GntR family transcriptional regulator [Ferrovibrio sp. MS7]|jgi:DNA-binding GntR family transcriptional regulator|uniref:GntR family transcriptional regulator n=1 Tax=Ferrovibrio TaxID=1231242 RepID=UPI0031353899
MNETIALRSAVLKRSTTTDDVRERLADEILLGQLEPGSRLDEQSLAQRFGVSRTPVREALKQLAVTGLVEARPHKGVVVSAVTPERLAQMFEAMADLEAACARHAALRMDDAERHALASLHALSREAATAGDFERYDQLNRDFHALILRGCHNDYLSEAAQSLRLRVTPFRRAQFLNPARIEESYAEHEALVAAILARDADAAQATMRGHLAQAGDASAEFLARPKHPI